MNGAKPETDRLSARHMRMPHVTPGMTVEELGLDSLAMVETIFAIEESFDIQVPYDSGDPAQTGFDLSSVGSILRAVEGLVAQKAA